MEFALPNGKIMGEVHGESIGSAFPRGILGSWDLAIPLEHVGGAIGIFEGFGNKAKGVVAAPFLALFLEAVDDKLVDLLLLHQSRLNIQA